MKQLILLLCLLTLPAYSATGISAAASAWNTAATWKTAEAGAGAIQVTRSANTETTTSYVYSTAFTCTNAKVIEGMVLHLYRVGVTGTVSVALSEDNGTTATREVTVNAGDLPAAQSEVYFTFSSTLTCDGGSDYKVGVKESAGGSGAFVYRDGTAGNWFHILQTSTAYGAAPAAADNLHIVGFAVTMDSTDSTDHGTVDIGQGGSVTFGVTAATAYVLKVSGDINVWSGGTLSVGTVGATMPSDSSGTILLDCASNVQYGLFVQNGGTLVLQGASKTVSTFLASDEAVNSTELTTADSTGWASGDAIAIASTTRTAAQSEKGALNGAASGTTLTVNGFGGAGGGLAYAHSGTAPTRAEIINLTRNVVVRGASASLQTYLYVATTATVNADYAEFYWLGSGTGSKRGIDLNTTTGSVNLAYCAIHDFLVSGSIGIVVTGGASDNFVVTYTVFYDTHTGGITTIATTGASWELSHNIIIKATTGTGITAALSTSGGVVSSNTVAGIAGSGFAISGTWSTAAQLLDNTSHSNATYGMTVGSLYSGSIIDGLTVWRNNNYGLYFTAVVRDLVIRNLVAFGNITANILFTNPASGILFDTITLGGEAAYATTNGISLPDYFIMADARFWNSSFGSPAAHTNDILLGQHAHVTLYMGDTTITIPAALFGNSPSEGSFIRIQRYGGTAVDHRSYYVRGTIQTDSVIFNTAAPSERITPSSATVKIESAHFPKTAANGATATFSVWVRKSAVGDAGGANYNGAQQRLVLKANPALGIDADVVLDTAAAAVGDWEELTGTSAAVTDDGTLEAVVDLDGTAGWVNVSDWQTAGGTTYWKDGLPAYGFGGAVTTRAYPVMQ
jgi:hypothetical protein